MIAHDMEMFYMANGKNSFILYCDLINTVEKLPDDLAGKLLKHILNYVNDNNPEIDDLLLEIAFEPIKQSLKRDLRKYETRQETARLNGLKGGRPKNPKKPKESQKTKPFLKEPRKPVSVSVSDSVSVSVSVSDKDKEHDTFVLPPNVNQAIWKEFEQHRKEINKPLSNLARTKNSNILKMLSHADQQYLVDYSIGGRYTGLFPEQLKKRSINENNRRTNTQSSGAMSAVDRVKRATGNNEPAVIDISAHGYTVDQNG